LTVKIFWLKLLDNTFKYGIIINVLVKGVRCTKFISRRPVKDTRFNGPSHGGAKSFSVEAVRRKNKIWRGDVFGISLLLN